ncbi:carboxypeptidase-like regulatory domain-containing protein [Natrinema salaciae]|nr:carboxypeptidase-like regulatory domain-containing protein [Natrinema salaciae]
MGADTVPTADRIDAQSDDPSQVVESVNGNEIPAANDAIASFNSQLQEKAGLLGVDVENVSHVGAVEAETVSEAHNEADRLRAAADDREVAIFDKVVTVINDGGVADVNRSEIQSPADARDVADRLEEEGGLATQAAQSLRDAADLIENDLDPALNGAADKLESLTGDESATGAVAGTVTGADGEPIANATVTAGDQQTTTDENGSYELELEPGEHALTVTADGYEDASENVTIEADATTTADVTLQQEGDGGSDSVGEVVESVNGNEIPAANDAIASFNSQLQEKAGLLGVDVENVTHVDEAQAETVSEAHDEADRLRAAADDREVAIFDKVVTVINDGGVADVNRSEIQSPADARDVADRLEEEGGLATQAAQSLRDAADLIENDLDPALNGAADKLESLEGDEPATGTVAGTVTGADGEPIANATVTAGDQQTTTDENGSYELELEPGEYALAVSAEGYQNASEDVTVEATATTTADATLQQEGDGGSDSVGEVVESVNGNEIPAANDALTSFNSQLQEKAGLLGVDVENVSHVDAVEAETVSEAHDEADRLRVAADDREVAIFDKVVTVINDGGVADVNRSEIQSPADARDVADRLEEEGGLATQAAQSLRDAADLIENDLDPALHGAADKLESLGGDEPATGTVAGTVTDADGEPVANATVTAGDQETTTAADGSYELELEPGEYALAVSADGYEDASENVTVEADATATVDVTLDAESTTGTIGGVVTDAAGEPVANATVAAGDQQTTTSESGCYALVLEPGEYALAVSADGYENASEDVTVDAGTTTTVNVTLELESTTGTVEGTVTDADGEPVANATVTAGDQEATTDANGSYVLELEAGDYTVTVSADGYEDASEDVTVEADATTTADVTLQQEDDGSDPIAEIVESVNENEIAETNAALEAFNDKVDNQTAEIDDEFDDVEAVAPVEATDAAEAAAEADRLRDDADDRQAAIFETVVGVINARAPDIVSPIVDPADVTTPEEARAEGERIEEEYGDISDDAALANESLHNAADLVEFTVQPNLNAAADKLENVSEPEPTTGTVEGTITDADGEPIANATVTAGDQQTTTDENGSYAIELEPGEHTLAVSAAGYEDASRTVTVEADAATTADVVLEPEPTTGTVEGTVTDTDGEPIADATVTVGDQQTTTDEDGSYALELEAGEYTLAVSADGYEDASEDVAVDAGATATVDVTLQQEDDEIDADVVVDATVDDETVAVGETVTVDVDIERVTADAETEFLPGDETEIGAYTLVLRYDADALEFESIDRPGWQVVDIANDGILIVDRAWVPPGQSEMPVDAFSAEFEVVDGAGDDATFEFDSAASSVDERTFFWKTQPLDAAYDGATVAIEEPDADGPEQPDTGDFPDDISDIWDVITGIGAEIGIGTAASPIVG